MSEQLPLSVGFRENAVFEDFLPGQNAISVGTLRSALTRLDQDLIVLWGRSGCGISHLLQASIHDLKTQGLNGVYLPLKEVVSYGVNALEDLAQCDALALDDLELIAEHHHWQEAIFHLYNQMKDAGKLILVGLNQSPFHLNLPLADLRSRLTSGLTLAIHPMSDDERIDWLIWKGRRRGLVIEREVAEFLIYRHHQNLGELEQTFEKLDSASLAHKRKLTIPFLKQTLAL